MQIVEVEEVQSGEHEGSLWVSIGIPSEDSLDVLHVVCPLALTEDDQELHQDDLYLERTDQGQSGNRLVQEVVLSDASAKFVFNDKGQRMLDFPPEVLFQFPESLPGVQEALACLREMSRLEAGRSIRT